MGLLGFAALAIALAATVWLVARDPTSVSRVAESGKAARGLECPDARTITFTYQLGPGAGRYATAEEAAEEEAKDKLRGVDRVEKDRSGKPNHYQATKNNKRVAEILVPKRSSGGYEVTGVIACASDAIDEP
jgi:hypothetical protein